MNKILSIFPAVGIVLSMLAFQCMIAPDVMAEADGTIIKQDGTKLTGTIRWLNSAKKYTITQGVATSEISADNVMDIVVAKPANLDRLAGMVNSGQGAAAAPDLEKLVEKYLMLQWDMPAVTYLIKACKLTKSSKGLDWGRKVASNRDGTSLPQSPEFFSAYMGALIENGRGSEVEDVIKQTIQNGAKEAVAVAYLKRGDLMVIRNNHKDALIDGYLRTILLHESVKEIQPEAIYKAVKSLEQLKQATYADKWRKKLLAEYPSDPYTARLKAGN